MNVHATGGDKHDGPTENENNGGPDRGGEVGIETRDSDLRKKSGHPGEKRR